jgi:hypothetical protein
MKTITKNYEVYTFAELTPEVQAKVIEREQQNEYLMDYPWYEYIVEDFVETKLTPIGFDTTTEQVFFSGFWSQGDGACFDGKLNVLTYLEHFKLQDKYPLTYQAALEGYVWATIHQNGYGNHYSHEKTRYIEIENEAEDALRLDVFYDDENKVIKLNDELIALQADLEEERYDLSRQLYRDLEKEYEHLTSDETIREQLLDNDTEYLASGSVFNG